MVRARSGGGARKTKSESSGSKKSSGSAGTDGAVITLTDDNFGSLACLVTVAVLVCLKIVFSWVQTTLC
jgi:hypothetical protein